MKKLFDHVAWTERGSRLGTSMWALLFCLSGQTAVAQEAVLEWEVVNRFPLFTQASDFARIAGIRVEGNETGERLWAASGKAADTVNAPGFSARLRTMLPPVERTAWRRGAGTYDRGTLLRSENQIVARSPLVGSGCEWRLTELVGEVPRGVPSPAKSGDCGWSGLMEIDIHKTYRLELHDAQGRAAAPPVRVKAQPRLVVAMGDSFASGEGNPDHPAVFKPGAGNKKISEAWWEPEPFRDAVKMIEHDAQWLDGQCHRSLLAWPSMAALRRAVEHPHEVVRFASFACSGAEVFDGLLVPQMNPPGFEYESEGLREVRTFPAGELPGESVGWELPRSQLDAVAHLVCHRGVEYGAWERPWGTKEQLGVGGNEHRKLFAPFRQPHCKGGAAVAVDQMLLMVGGNDTGFSGIVRYVLMPNKVTYRRLPFVSGFMNGMIRSRLAAVEPRDAVEKGVVHLPALYRVLREAMDELGLRQDRTVLAIYPRVVSAREFKGDDAALEACRYRTADGFTPLQVVLESEARHGGARFGASPARLRKTHEGYITTLRAAQMGHLGQWLPLDVDGVFKTGGFCSTQCDDAESRCPNANRVRWQWTTFDEELSEWNEKTCSKIIMESDQGPKGTGRSIGQITHSCATPPLRNLSDFDPYDSQRKRGLRYATDMFLAAAARSPKGEGARIDVLTGSVHPTANRHAEIADHVTWRWEEE